jgi:acyl dehydratase
MALKYFEDFEGGVGYQLGSRPVTAEEIIDFARQFDPLPFHTDPEAAKDSAFGGLIASGWHVGSMYMRLFVDGFLSGIANRGSPGLDEVRFLVPVRPGDILTARYTIDSVEPSNKHTDRGTLHGTGELFNQDGEIVFRFHGRTLITRRGTDADGDVIRGVP